MVVLRVEVDPLAVGGMVVGMVVLERCGKEVCGEMARALMIDSSLSFRDSSCPVVFACRFTI